MTSESGERSSARVEALSMCRFGIPALAPSTGPIAVTRVNGLFRGKGLVAPPALGLMLLVGLTPGAIDRAVVPLPSRPVAP